MPITTDSYYDIVYDEETLDRIGLSKTLDNYTIEEIADYAFVGSYSYYGRQISEKSLPDYTYVGYSTLHGNCPFAASFNAPNYDQIWCDNGGTTHYNLTENGIYRAVCLMHRTNNDPYPYQLTEDDFEYMQIITEMDAPKYSVNFGNTEDMEFSDTPYWRPHDFTSKYNTHLGAADNVEIATCGFVPYIVLQFQEHYFFINANTIWTGEFSDAPSFSATYINNSSRSVCANQLYDYTASYYAGISEAVNQWFQSYDFTDPIDTPFIKTVNLSTPEEYWCQYDGYASRIGFQYSAEDGFSQYFCFTTLDKLKLYIAGICGLHFIVDATVYKPIIIDNFVVGYSSDLNITSDLDNYVGSTKHDLPVTPPAPPAPVHPSGDIETDMPLAYIGGTAGMVDFIKINAAGLASADDIADAVSRFDITTIGKDLLRNFVAFKCYAVLDIDDSVVRDIKVAGHTLKDENDNALQGEYIGGVAPVDFSAGKIEPLYNDFRDYAPYTRIQMYVPFCGWFDLPSWCMGKEITGTMFTDLYNGTVKAVIYASRTVVAEVGGCCAFDIPFAAESTGTKAGAVISSALNTIAMTGATVAAPNIATGIAAVSSAANFISAANSNGTTLKGVMGDGSNTNGLLHVYIKTTRPNSPDGKREIPERYKHEYGIPCFKQLTLTAGDGYTQIMDANITGAMTDREKQMIIDGFRHGLIL